MVAEDFRANPWADEEITVEVQWIPCPDCSGSGVQPGSERGLYVTCPTCRGMGQTVIPVVAS